MAFELALGDLSESQVQTGVMRAIREGGTHPPSAAEVRALALGRADRDLQALAHEAFKRADQLARTHGVAADYRGVLDDPLATHALGAVGGWGVFCRKVDEWQERTFVAAYVGAAKNPTLEEVAKLSHKGKPLGLLAKTRKQMAEALALPNYGGVENNA
ncbi:hypothetical protein [Aeoliella mucimassa]|uniref:hypothetical protein n=1 Tax=Aeoliella mucimassa TaxID=2527972 RepID=UPI0011A49EE0|nr:hypothetical protein [Aeoliella mucimassa]